MGGGERIFSYALGTKGRSFHCPQNKRGKGRKKARWGGTGTESKGGGGCETTAGERNPVRRGGKKKQAFGKSPSSRKEKGKCPGGREKLVGPEKRGGGFFRPLEKRLTGGKEKTEISVGGGKGKALFLLVLGRIKLRRKKRKGVTIFWAGRKLNKKGGLRGGKGSRPTAPPWQGGKKEANSIAVSSSKENNKQPTEGEEGKEGEKLYFAGTDPQRGRGALPSNIGKGGGKGEKRTKTPNFSGGEK